MSAAVIRLVVDGAALCGGLGLERRRAKDPEHDVGGDAAFANAGGHPVLGITEILAQEAAADLLLLAQTDDAVECDQALFQREARFNKQTHVDHMIPARASGERRPVA